MSKHSDSRNVIIGGIFTLAAACIGGFFLLANTLLDKGFTVVGPALKVGDPSTQVPSRAPINTQPPPAAKLFPDTSVSSQDRTVLIYIAAGEFMMGSGSNPDELPVHSVYVSDFWIDETEVTNEKYAECVAAGICAHPAQRKSYTRSSYYGDSDFNVFPVINVSWMNAKKYCDWAGRDLPTEAQWEKAASWNETTKESYIYPWGNNFDGSALNFCDSRCTLPHANKDSDDGYADTSPVRNYPNGVSPYGAYDMSGNVWEWVSDWYGETYYSNSPSSDPVGPDSGTFRVLRGDSWYGYDYSVRSADRNPFDPSKFAENIGFRCASSHP